MKTHVTKFRKNGRFIEVVADTQVELLEKIPAGTYVIKSEKTIMGIRFWLEELDNELFIPAKVYGDAHKKAERVINTFHIRQNHTGVLLEGEKGSGKTLTARIICKRMAKEYGIPTLVITSPLQGDEFNSFLQSIHQPVVVFMDEFEKTYKAADNEDSDDSQAQNSILTLLDGVYSSDNPELKRLFLLTINNKYLLNANLILRPGRIYYHFAYTGVDEAFINDYCTDRLLDKNKLHNIHTLAKMHEHFNFDMLAAVVEEMNRYQDTLPELIAHLNVKPQTRARASYKILVERYIDGVLVKMDTRRDKTSGHHSIFDDLVISVDGVAKDHDRDYDEDGEGNSTSSVSITLGQDDIVKMNMAEGVIVYKFEDYVATLTRIDDNRIWNPLLF